MLSSFSCDKVGIFQKELCRGGGMKNITVLIWEMINPALHHTAPPGEPLHALFSPLN